MKYKLPGQFANHWPGIARKFTSAGGKNGAENNRLTVCYFSVGAEKDKG